MKTLVDKVIGGAKTFIDNTRQYVGAVADGVGTGMKSLADGVGTGARNLAVYGLVGVVSLGAGARIAEATTVMDFKDLINPPSGILSQSVQMARGPPVEDYDNLMIRDLTGVASVVSKTGYYDSINKKWIGETWRIGFAKNMGTYINFGGYANNDNFSSNSNPTILGGWCQGNYTSAVFADGSTADDVMIIHDAYGDGIGNVVDGVWTLGTDDVPYWTEDIEFNGKQGDLRELGSFTYTGETKILPHMTINDRVPRSGSAGMGELKALSENWLGQDCHPYYNADCDCADWNYDGRVDFQDFVHMAKDWDPNYVIPPRTGPAGMNELAILSENWLRQDCQPYGINGSDGADWNYDGGVDFQDFAYMAKDWDPNYVPVE